MLLFLEFHNPIRMTACAVCQLVHRDPGARMAGCDKVWLVIVAAVAGNITVASWVAYLAVTLSLTPMVEGKAMGEQLCWSPGLRCVAVLALQSEETGMDSRLGMAGNTFGGCANKFLFLVAAGAFQTAVATIEREEPGVIEIAHAVNSVVAIQTIFAEQLPVSLKKIRTLQAAGVAGDACSQIKIHPTCQMAIKTDHGLILIVKSVAC